MSILSFGESIPSLRAASDCEPLHSTYAAAKTLFFSAPSQCTCTYARRMQTFSTERLDRFAFLFGDRFWMDFCVHSISCLGISTFSPSMSPYINYPPTNDKVAFARYNLIAYVTSSQDSFSPGP